LEVEIPDKAVGDVLVRFVKTFVRFWFLFGLVIRRGMAAAFDTRARLCRNQEPPPHNKRPAPTDRDIHEQE